MAKPTERQRKAAEAEALLPPVRVEPQAMTVRESDPFLSLIERLSLDERIDPVKLGQIFDLKRGLEADRAKIEYQQAFAAMSERLPAISKKGQIKNRDGKVQSTYAKYEHIQKVIKPILREFGFTLNHEQAPDNGTEMILTTFLIHRGGHSQRSTFRAKTDTSGSKNDVQGLGSIASYAKRYNVIALLDLEVHGADDDAQTARPTKAEPAPRKQQQAPPPSSRQIGGEVTIEPFITTEQRDQLARVAFKIGRKPEDVSLWLRKAYGVQSSASLFQKDFAAVKAALEARGSLPMPGDGEGSES